MAQVQGKTRYPRDIKRLIEAIDYLRPHLRSLSDAEITAKSDELKVKAKDGVKIDKLLVEAYALVSETAYRTIKMRPYEEQLWGAVALHSGAIIQMNNGEGKTLTATMPAYLNSLAGDRTHIATYNSYLARRDAQWMGPIYGLLELSVGVIETDNAYRLEQDKQDNTSYALVSCERRNAYACDIIYGIHGDFVIDYLRDNMVTEQGDIVQDDRLDYIILDEADSVLIDLARSPSSIVTPLPCNPHKYYILLEVAQHLQVDKDYISYPQAFMVELTEHGIAQTEVLLRANHLMVADTQLYSVENAGIAEQLTQTLRALHFYKKDRDYIVENNKVVPINTYTGRLSHGGSLTNGIQQAVEANERVAITPESRTLASISYQHFFKLYKKMAGMTATAKESEQEFLEVYGKHVVQIPPRLVSRRHDFSDLIYRNTVGRQHGILEQIKEIHASERPVLIDIHSIEKADELGRQIEAIGISCHVLHAKREEQEAEIIAQAGQRGTVTIAAKMAGRGTDIVIDEDVSALGGLHVIGVERYNSSHMDLQLIGRAGRQGKQGSSVFFIAFDDELMRRITVDGTADFMKLIGMEENVPVESRLVTQMIESAQRKVENDNRKQRQEAYDIDTVLDKQRRSIYAIRRKAVLHSDLGEEIAIIERNVAVRSVEKFLKGKKRQEWDFQGLAKYFCGLSIKYFDLDSIMRLASQDRQHIEQELINTVAAVYDQQRKESAEDRLWVQRERATLLYCLSKEWTNHLERLEQLQEATFLRANLEESRLAWYSIESYKLFWDMLELVEVEFLQSMLSSSIEKGE